MGRLLKEVVLQKFSLTMMYLSINYREMFRLTCVKFHIILNHGFNMKSQYLWDFVVRAFLKPLRVRAPS